MAIINLHAQLNNFINVRNWGNADKTSEATLTDINRTTANFGNVPLEVIQAEAGIGFKKEDRVFRKEKRPLTEDERKLLFDKVCGQLFKDAGLTKEQENGYRYFLSLHLHQKALYHQGAKWLQAQLSPDFFMTNNHYEAKLEFKNGILYLNDTLTSDKYIDISGVGSSCSIVAKAEFKIEIKNDKQVINANVAVNDFSIDYSPEWEQFLGKFAQLEKKSNKGLSFLRRLSEVSFFQRSEAKASGAQVEPQHTIPACSK